MGFFENTRIDSANAAELSAVTYTEVVLDAGASVTINGIPITSTGLPTTVSIRVHTVSGPSGNVYLVGTPNEADQSPVAPSVVTTYYYVIDYIIPDYFVTETS